MKLKYTFPLLYFYCFLLLFQCKEKSSFQNTTDNKKIKKIISKKIPLKNEKIIQIVKEYGPEISPTYEKAVCTELVIQVLEKIQPLSKEDKSRIRIITEKDIHSLLNENSEIPKGVFYALTKNGQGIAINDQEEVSEGDLVQFWTATWGHCGIVKSINPGRKEMELYSSFPSTNGYGIQKFTIPEHAFFVRLK